MNIREEGMSDWNIKSVTPMPTPGQLKKEIPLMPGLFENVVASARTTISNILAGEDSRLLVVVGPCSVHNISETLQYARILTELQKKVADKIFIVMRVCLDKPRTGRGWAGFFQDPDLNQSRNIQDGWRRGRKLLVDIIQLGLPIAMELLDADACQNIDECVSYWWIGARTVKSQRLREVASGLSTPVGFKNPTDGKIDDAIEAIDTAWHDSAFVATNEAGVRCEYRTEGNKYSNLILRGSDRGPNFDRESVEKAVHSLAHRGLMTRIIVDVSHGNSGKDFSRQQTLIDELVDRIVAGDNRIAGILYESYLEEGNQPLPKDLSNLKPNLSVTDACDSIETTREVLLRAHEKLAKISG
jgi:3-deoxy-7-phosphoheptulonate synthase